MRPRDYAGELFALLWPRLPAEVIKAIESHAVTATELHDPVPNAYCRPVDGGFAIAFHSGMKDFVYRVIRAVSTRFAMQSVDGALETAEAIPFDDTCRYVGDIFLWYRETQSAFGPEYPIRPDQLVLANVLTVEANLFFFAHELAHGIMHIEGSAPEKDIEEEYLADQIATTLVLRRNSNDETSPPQLYSYAGIELALLIWEGLERFGIRFAGTHPRASDRLEAVRSALATRCRDAAGRACLESAAKGIRAIFEEMLASIGEDSYDRFLERAAGGILRELDDLLDRCTRTDTPDYATFHAEAGRFFTSGYSLKLSRKIGETTARWLDLLDEWRGGEGVDFEKAELATRKQKLFLSYVSDLPPQIRRIYGKALGIDWDAAAI
jgi:hypothetical protein